MPQRRRAGKLFTRLNECPCHALVSSTAAPAGARARLGNAIDDLVCVHVPAQFFSVGQFYLDFDQVDDETVRDLLDRAAGSPDSA